MSLPSVPPEPGEQPGTSGARVPATERPAGSETRPAPRSAAVILAGGSGSRVGAGTNKVLLSLAGWPILVHSVRTVLDVPGVHRLVVVARPEDHPAVAEALRPHLGTHDAWLVPGGAERHDSEWRAMRALAPDIEAGEIDVVAVHDAARPLATVDLWCRVITEAARGTGALPFVALGPVSRRDCSPLPPATSPLAAVQTPQAFAAATLLEAHRSADGDGWHGTDTASVIERYRPAGTTALAGVPSTALNLKVTYPEDLQVAARLLRD